MTVLGCTCSDRAAATTERRVLRESAYRVREVRAVTGDELAGRPDLGEPAACRQHGRCYPVDAEARVHSAADSEVVGLQGIDAAGARARPPSANQPEADRGSMDCVAEPGPQLGRIADLGKHDGPAVNRCGLRPYAGENGEPRPGEGRGAEKALRVRAVALGLPQPSGVGAVAEQARERTRRHCGDPCHNARRHCGNVKRR